MITQRTEILAEIERRREDLSLGLLKIYNYYRTFIGLALLVAYQQDFLITKLGSLDAQLFLWVTAGYTAINVATALLSRLIPQVGFNRQNLSIGLILFDVVSLAVIMYASGGIGSGIGALILITVVTGAILVTGQIATLIAAAASITILYEEFYLAISIPGTSGAPREETPSSGAVCSLSLIVIGCPCW